MSTVSVVKQLLGKTLQLGDRAQLLTPETQLLGSMPELDSMAIVTVITAMEDAFGIYVSDDEISAEVFETVETLARFVDQKLSR